MDGDNRDGPSPHVAPVATTPSPKGGGATLFDVPQRHYHRLEPTALRMAADWCSNKAKRRLRLASFSPDKTDALAKDLRNRLSLLELNVSKIGADTASQDPDRFHDVLLQAAAELRELADLVESERATYAERSNSKQSDEVGAEPIPPYSLASGEWITPDLVVAKFKKSNLKMSEGTLKKNRARSQRRRDFEDFNGLFFRPTPDARPNDQPLYYSPRVDAVIEAIKASRHRKK